MQIGELRESGKPTRCAYCHAPVEDAPVSCAGCGTQLHAECVEALPRCPTLGCSERPRLRVTEPRSPRRVGVRTGVLTLGLLAAIALAVFASRPQLHHTACAIGFLRTVWAQEKLLWERSEDENGKRHYGTLAQLGEAGFIDSVLASGRKSGYRIEARPGSDPEKTWWAVARPDPVGFTGTCAYYTNQDGVIYYVECLEGTPIPMPNTADGTPPEGARKLGS